MTKATKPPTQVAGVEGIAPKPIVLTPEPSTINWAQIIQLPPFQMFAVERNPSLVDKFEGSALDSVTAWMAQFDPDDLYEQYSGWHEDKGYWQNENPDGSLKENEA